MLDNENTIDGFDQQYDFVITRTICSNGAVQAQNNFCTRILIGDSNQIQIRSNTFKQLKCQLGRDVGTS